MTGRTSRPAATQPFAALDVAAARRYQAWYATDSGRQVADTEARLLLRLLGRPAGGRTLLDIGTGTGHFARAFAAAGYQVTGLDPAAGMLAVAHELGGGPRYLRGDALALPFVSGSFDVVTMVTSLEFVADQVAALREAGRVARHGLILGVLNLASPLNLKRMLEARTRPSPYRHARFLTPWGVEQRARRALGARVLAVRRRTALWPDSVPAACRRLPFGAFIGCAVALRPPGRERGAAGGAAKAARSRPD